MIRIVHHFMLLTLVVTCAGCATVKGNRPTTSADASHFSVAAFLPEGYKIDGSLSYQVALQEALDRSPDGATVVFPPMNYLLDNADGLRVPGNRTLQLDGAFFILARELDRDGQAFLLDSVSNVTIRGGTIEGQREEWLESVNIAGIRARGISRHLRIERTRFLDLSSNAVGIFGDSLDRPIRNVWIEDIYADNCCNIYYDYLAQQRGPAEGSVREDQGAICLYNVSDFVVRGSYLEDSRSDGTHFKSCRNGQISDNQIVNSQMGGFFLEECRNIVAQGNIMRNNGSRGCTIERDSTDCVLSNNIVERSGREGLWAPDVTRITVSGNIFRENGQKDDAEKDSEIRISDEARYLTVPSDIVIEGNIFQTRKQSNGVIQVNLLAGSGIAITNNTFSGPVRNLIIDPGVYVTVTGNSGLE